MTNILNDIITSYADGIRLTVRAKPGISHGRPLRIVDLGENKKALEVAVAASAHDGKANKAIIERLANAMFLRKSDVSIKSGESSRLKVIEISGDSFELQQRLIKLLAIDEASS